MNPTRLLLLLLAVLLAACDRDPPQAPQLDLDGRTMGTYWSVRIVEPPAELDPAELQERLEERLRAVNARMSIYDPESELSVVNRSTVGDWVPVSESVVAVVAAAREISALSSGAFDVTVAPLVNLWGFGVDRVEGMPDPVDVAAALERVDWRALEVRRDPPALRRTVAVEVDLGGIAKGHGVDVLAQTLEEEGIDRYLVDIGGDTRARGRNARGTPWRIGVEVPAPGRRGAVHAVLELESGAVATSGDYRNFFMHEGVRYAHIIDPSTGWPVVQHVASVTVIHPSAMWSDGLSTAMAVLGPDAGLALAREHSWPVLFILYSEQGLVERASPEFAAYRAAGES